MHITKNAKIRVNAGGVNKTAKVSFNGAILNETAITSVNSARGETAEITNIPINEATQVVTSFWVKAIMNLFQLFS